MQKNDIDNLKLSKLKYALAVFSTLLFIFSCARPKPSNDRGQNAPISETNPNPPTPNGVPAGSEDIVQDPEQLDDENQDKGEDQTTEDSTNQQQPVPDSNDSELTTGTPVYFNIALSQTILPCSACGIWFDWQGKQEWKPKLEIAYTYENQSKTIVLQEGLNGMKNAYSIGSSPSKSHDSVEHKMLVKGGMSFGYFIADIQEVPKGATINGAWLYLTLHRDEGMSNNDDTTEITIYEYPKVWKFGTDFKGEQFGVVIRKLQAKEDFIAQGVQKYFKPTGKFEFTEYVKKLQGKR